MVRSSDIAAFNHPEDFNQSITVYRHELKMVLYVTDIEVSLNEAEEIMLHNEGFKKLPVDLNPDSKGNKIYFWYKTSDCPAITRIQFSFTDKMKDGLIAEGYHQVEKNLNAGNSGSPIYLWFHKVSSPYDVPIVDLHLSIDAAEDARNVQPLWERLPCDLNRRAGGKWIYLWVKRETQTYICDITANFDRALDANLFHQGYIRMDEDTNRGVFLWYRQSTDSQNAIKDLQVSTNQEDIESYNNQNYVSVLTNLNEGTMGTPVYVWYKRNDCGRDPINFVTLIHDPAAVQPYEKAGVTVIQKNLNKGNSTGIEYLCYK
ncbi:uncharacterized protein LOC124878460 [Girardinichthys multiradiatus]|uniref:uncharacterized protein LOC124878460 n=1 Tax=Girardinichthys multiradiatus TaxID=208333 RepID=UPI001FAC9D63|nr:uncharacterized protein LOC124878460 [Girardinichthys multiradiatus]